MIDAVFLTNREPQRRKSYCCVIFVVDTVVTEKVHVFVPFSQFEPLGTCLVVNEKYFAAISLEVVDIPRASRLDLYMSIDFA